MALGKLTAAELKDLHARLKRHDEARGNLAAKFRDFINDIADDINALTEARNVVAGWFEDISQEWADAYSEKSEKWQESEKGEAINEAIGALSDKATEIQDEEEISSRLDSLEEIADALETFEIELPEIEIEGESLFD